MLTVAQMTAFLDALRSNFNDAQVINRRPDSAVIRWLAPHSNGSIIAKMWARPGLRGHFRRLLRILPCHYEWRNLRRLEVAGVPVPHPLGFCGVVPAISGYTDVLFMQDLGDCVPAGEYLKRLIRSSSDMQSIMFENVIIDMSDKIIRAGMIDTDYGMNNIVVTSDGRTVKIDVELVRRVFWPNFFPRMYSLMLGRLIGLHAFAVQPEVVRTVDFAERLYARLKPSARVRELTNGYVQKLLLDQFRSCGIDTRVELPIHKV